MLVMAGGQLGHAPDNCARGNSSRYNGWMHCKKLCEKTLNWGRYEKHLCFLLSNRYSTISSGDISKHSPNLGIAFRLIDDYLRFYLPSIVVWIKIS